MYEISDFEVTPIKTYHGYLYSGEWGTMTEFAWKDKKWNGPAGRGRFTVPHTSRYPWGRFANVDGPNIPAPIKAWAEKVPLCGE